MPKGQNGGKRSTNAIGCAVTVGNIATGVRKNTRYTSKKRRKSDFVNAQTVSLSAERRSGIATQSAQARRHNGEKEMSEICSTTLHDLLSGGGRELQNIKFLAGTNPTKEGMCTEATKVIKSAMDRDLPHTPPATGVSKTKL